MATKIKITLKVHPKYEYAYDDEGAYCRMHISTEDWQVLEPHCLNCGTPTDEEPERLPAWLKEALDLEEEEEEDSCCGEFEPGMYINESTNTVHMLRHDTISNPPYDILNTKPNKYKCCSACDNADEPTESAKEYMRQVGAVGISTCWRAYYRLDE